MQACTPDRTDLVADKRAYFLLWRLPWLAIAASLPLRDSALKAGIWTTAFAQMGVACPPRQATPASRSQREAGDLEEAPR